MRITIDSLIMDQATINADIAAAHDVIARLRTEVGRAVIGQEAIVDRLVIALLIRGHVLLEGVPGLPRRFSSGRSPAPSTRRFTESNSRPTCYRLTSPAR